MQKTNLSKKWRAQKTNKFSANTNYIWKSSIPYMQKLLNKDNENLNKVLNQSPSYASEICHFDSITIYDLH